MGEALSKKRCPWVRTTNPEYVAYHDNEWGKPVHEDPVLFEFLTLEGAQAGLSWETILAKRENYRRAFHHWDVPRVARITPRQVDRLVQDPGLVRHRLKIESTVTNAQAFLAIQKDFGSFAKFLWDYVEGKPQVHRFSKMSDYPTQSDLSRRISKDLKKKGFRFVGPTIVYAYLQAVGLVDDHSSECYLA